MDRLLSPGLETVNLVDDGSGAINFPRLLSCLSIDAISAGSTVTFLTADNRKFKQSVGFSANFGSPIQISKILTTPHAAVTLTCGVGQIFQKNGGDVTVSAPLASDQYSLAVSETQLNAGSRALGHLGGGGGNTATWELGSKSSATFLFQTPFPLPTQGSILVSYGLLGKQPAPVYCLANQKWYLDGVLPVDLVLAGLANKWLFYVPNLSQAVNLATGDPAGASSLSMTNLMDKSIEPVVSAQNEHFSGLPLSIPAPNQKIQQMFATGPAGNYDVAGVAGKLIRVTSWHVIAEANRVSLFYDMGTVSVIGQAQQVNDGHDEDGIRPGEAYIMTTATPGAILRFNCPSTCSIRMNYYYE